MEQLRASVTGVCMLSAAVGICTLLRPGKELERQVRFLISVLFLLSIIVPLTQMELPAWTAEETVQAADSTAFESALLRETQTRTEDALRERLTEAGISCEALSVTLYMGEDRCIYCSEVQAVCSEPDSVYTVLREALGEEAVIRVTEAAEEAE